MHVSAWVEACLPTPEYPEALQGVLAAAVMEAMRAAVGYYGLAPPPGVSMSDVAGIWNRALLSLGYDVSSAHTVVLAGRRAAPQPQ